MQIMMNHKFHQLSLEPTAYIFPTPLFFPLWIIVNNSKINAAVPMTMSIPIFGSIFLWKNDNDDDNDQSFLWNDWPKKGVKPYSQTGPVS